MARARKKDLFRHRRRRFLSPRRKQPIRGGTRCRYLKGDQALFHMGTAMLKRKMGVPDSRPLADFLPTISIKAKDFASEMTSVNVQSKDLHGENLITQEHIDNNTAVRKMLIERGIVPEQLPAEKDVKKVARRLATEEKKALRSKKKRK